MSPLPSVDVVTHHSTWEPELGCGACGAQACHMQVYLPSAQEDRELLPLPA